MLAGYTSAEKPKSWQRFPGDAGTKQHIWPNHGNPNEAGWLVIDEWRTTPYGDGSNGTTSLYHKGILTWEMVYGGFYPEDVISFLKETIREAYTDHHWKGGRGRAFASDNKHRYTNEAHGDFARFYGSEHIETLGENGYGGFHRYWGGFMY